MNSTCVSHIVLYKKSLNHLIWKSYNNATYQISYIVRQVSSQVWSEETRKTTQSNGGIIQVCTCQVLHKTNSM
jgi:hypothetical protein